MKKFILAAALLAPLGLAAPALADDAAGFVETPAVTTYAPTQPREFTARYDRVSNADQSLINREAVPSSAFSSSN
ncbi:MAG: hypothetical protein J0H01_37495 [Rhizobiales bacterium]|nr:hypothetical protein [Hyphomicrobiales bacterium]